VNVGGAAHAPTHGDIHLQGGYERTIVTMTAFGNTKIDLHLRASPQLEEESMTIATQTVGEIALQQPMSIRVFERFGIEYCCGGRKPLAEACKVKDVAVEKVIAALEAASRKQAAGDRDWSKESLANLIVHIVAKHHTYCKNELVRLSGLAIKVTKRYGGTNPELSIIQTKFAQLAEKLTEHLAEEEVFAFPMISKLERNRIRNSTTHGNSHAFVNRPLSLLAQDHDDAGTLMAEIRSLSRNFIPPDYACATYRALYEGLKEFEQDLHQHVHLENNILFPRAIKLEATS
jgi:regulator of cell morphogenesis and NO signaling